MSKETWMPTFDEIGNAWGADAGVAWDEYPHLTALIRRAAAKRALEILLSFQQTTTQAQCERLTNASFHHLCSYVDVNVARLRKEITAAEIAAEGDGQ